MASQVISRCFFSKRFAANVPVIGKQNIKILLIHANFVQALADVFSHFVTINQREAGTSRAIMYYLYF